MVPLDLPFGTTFECDGLFKDEDGNLFDPADAVKYMTQDPTGTEATYVYGVDDEVTRLSTGTYHFAFLPPVSGQWLARGKGTDGVREVASLAIPFYVIPSQFAQP